MNEGEDMPDLDRLARLLREALKELEVSKPFVPAEPAGPKKPWTVPCRKCGQPIGFKTLHNGKKCPVNPGTEIPHDCDVTKYAEPMEEPAMGPEESDGLPF